jgi:hypothetical protein
MDAILPGVSAGVFEPNDVEAMSLAYQDVCNTLHINGDAGAREAIAARVIELARRGELRRTVLGNRVLAEANAGHWVLIS